MPPSRLSPHRPMHFRLGRMLGKGAYGAVHEALLESGASVAVKRVDLGRCARGPGKDSRLAFNVESEVLRNLPSHPHVVAFLASEAPRGGQGEALIWMECVSGGSVSGVLKTYGAMREDTAGRFAAHVLSGLVFLHSNRVVHRDVKPANLLVTVCGTVKIGDFGSACVVDGEGGKAKGIAGTPNYMAPEIFRMVNNPTGGEAQGDGTYDCKADVWSLGMTLIEMLTAHPPYSELSNPFAVMFHIARHPTPPLPPSASSRALAFLARCLERCPEARSSSLDLCTDPFLPPQLGRLNRDAGWQLPPPHPCYSCDKMRRGSLLAAYRGIHPPPPPRNLSPPLPLVAAAQDHPAQQWGGQFRRAPSAPQ
uniref:Protein kinase domain-containing protein n=1 Tax=Hemiselmis andersenii TaxID=464988 RepID=A0A7S1DE84_HEMAN